MPDYALGEPRLHTYAVSVSASEILDYVAWTGREGYGDDPPPAANDIVYHVKPGTAGNGEYTQDEILLWVPAQGTWNVLFSSLATASIESFYAYDDASAFPSWHPGDATYVYEQHPYTPGDPNTDYYITLRQSGPNRRRRWRVTIGGPTGRTTYEQDSPSASVSLSFMAQEMLTLNADSARHYRKIIGNATLSSGAVSLSFPLPGGVAETLLVTVGAANLNVNASVTQFGAGGMPTTGYQALHVQREGNDFRQSWSESQSGQSGSYTMTRFAHTEAREVDPIGFPGLTAVRVLGGPNGAYATGVSSDVPPNLSFTARETPVQETHNLGSVLQCFPVTNLEIICKSQTWPDAKPIAGMPVQVKVETFSDGVHADGRAPLGVKTTDASGTARFSTFPPPPGGAPNGIGQISATADLNWLVDRGQNPSPTPRAPLWTPSGENVGRVAVPASATAEFSHAVAQFTRANAQRIDAAPDAGNWKGLAAPTASYAPTLAPSPSQPIITGYTPPGFTAPRPIYYTPPFDSAAGNLLAFANLGGGTQISLPASATPGRVYMALRSVENDGKRRAFRLLRFLRVRIFAARALSLTLVLQSFSGTNPGTSPNGPIETLIAPLTVTFPLALAMGENDVTLDLMRGPAAPFAPSTSVSTGFIRSANRPDFALPTSPIFDPLGEWLLQGISGGSSYSLADRKRDWKRRNVWYARLDGIQPGDSFIVEELSLKDAAESGQTPLRVSADPPAATVGFSLPFALRALSNGRPVAALPADNPQDLAFLDPFVSGWNELVDGGSGLFTATRTGTDAEGQLAVNTLAAQNVTAGGFTLALRPRLSSFTFSAGFDALVSPSVTIYWNLGGQIEGVVFDADSQQKLTGKSVKATLQYPSGGPVQDVATVTTDNDGYFALPGIYQPTNTRQYKVSLPDDVNQVSALLTAPHRAPVHYAALARIPAQGGALGIDSAHAFLHVAAGKPVSTYNAQNDPNPARVQVSGDYSVDSWAQFLSNRRDGRLLMLGRRGGAFVLFYSADGGVTATEGFSVTTASAQIGWDSERGTVTLLYQNDAGAVQARQSQDGGVTFGAAMAVVADGAPLNAALLSLAHDERRGAFHLAARVGTDVRVFVSTDVCLTWTRQL